MKVIFLFKGRKLFHTQWHYISVWVCMFCLLDNHNCKLHLHEVNIPFFRDITQRTPFTHTPPVFIFLIKKIKGAGPNKHYIRYFLLLFEVGWCRVHNASHWYYYNVAKHFISEIISLTICVTYATYRKV